MSLSITCSNCQKNLKVKEELAGKKVRCPECSAAISVPAKSAAAEDDFSEDLDEAASPRRKRRVVKDEDEFEDMPVLKPRASKSSKKKSSKGKSSGMRWLLIGGKCALGAVALVLITVVIRTGVELIGLSNQDRRSKESQAEADRRNKDRMAEAFNSHRQSLLHLPEPPRQLGVQPPQQLRVQPDVPGLQANTARQAELLATEKDRVQADVRSNLNAFQSGDLDTLLRFTHPKVLEMMGGIDKAKVQLTAVIAQMQSAGISIESLNFPQDPIFIETKANLYVIVHTQGVGKAGNGVRLESVGFQLGIRPVGTTEWTYVDGSGVTNTNVRTFFPDFPTGQVLPTTSRRRL